MRKRLLFVILSLWLCSCDWNGERNQVDEFSPKIIAIDEYDTLVHLESQLIDYFEIDEQENVFLTKNQGQYVYKYLSNGKMDAFAGGFGFGPGEFEDGKIIRISLHDNNLIGFNVNSSKIKVYDLSLNLIEEIPYQGVLLDAEAFSDELIITSTVSTGISMNSSIKLFDSSQNLFKGEIGLIGHKNSFYRNLFTITTLNEESFIVSYLAINSVQIYDSSGNLITDFKLLGLPDEAAGKEYFGRTIPESLIIRDTAYDSMEGNLLFIEGGGDNLTGSNTIHSYSVEGEYNYTIKLPVSVEQIRLKNGSLYSLVRDSLSSSITKFEIR